MVPFWFIVSVPVVFTSLTRVVLCFSASLLSSSSFLRSIDANAGLMSNFEVFQFLNSDKNK